MNHDLTTSTGKSISTSAATTADLQSTLNLMPFTPAEKAELIQKFEAQTGQTQAGELPPVLPPDVHQRPTPTRDVVVVPSQKVDAAAVRPAVIIEPPTQQEETFKQVESALAPGATVSPSALRAADISEPEIRRLSQAQEEQRQSASALADLSAIKGVRDGDSFDLRLALQGGATPATLRTAGFTERDITNAQFELDVAPARPPKVKPLVQIEVDVAPEQTSTSVGPEPQTRPPLKVTITERKSARAPGPLTGPDIPRAEVRERPVPGKELPLPKDLKKAESRALKRSAMTLTAAGDVGPTRITQDAAAKHGAIHGVNEQVKQGDLTVDEARTAVKTIQTERSTGSLRDTAYIVPGYGTFLTFQDAKKAGFDPLSTGFFVGSVGLDLIFFAPVPGGALRAVKAPLSKVSKISMKDVAADRMRDLIAANRAAGRAIREERGSVAFFARPGAPEGDIETSTQGLRRIAEAEQRQRARQTALAAEGRALQSETETAEFGAHQLRLAKAEEAALAARITKVPRDTIPLSPAGLKSTSIPARPRREAPGQGTGGRTKPDIKPDVRDDSTRNEPLPAIGHPIEDTPTPMSSPAPITEPGITTEPTARSTKRPTATPTTQPDIRISTRPSPKPTTRPETRPTTRPEARPVAKPITRPETRPEARPETHPTTKPETRPEARPEAKTETEPAVRPEVRAETHAIPRPTTKPATRPVTRPEVHPQTRPETKPVLTTTPKPMTTPKAADTPKPPTTTPKVPTTFKPPVRPPTPQFKLPKGKELPEGQFPRRVSWDQGVVRITYDLVTGRRTYARGSHPEATPSETFRIVETTDRPPRTRRFPMGTVDVDVDQAGLSFKGRRSRRTRAFRSRSLR